IMDVSERIKALISENPDIQTIRKAAREEGMVTLRECAVKKMLEGITTYEEVISVT
ncbi:MAG: hypothetical protein HY883_02255, partial [Deltaproteobacteria bacterium]|nr:hypothetical protein [Deltaproteobacteria bacterium]